MQSRYQLLIELDADCTTAAAREARSLLPHIFAKSPSSPMSTAQCASATHRPTPAANTHGHCTRHHIRLAHKCSSDSTCTVQQAAPCATLNSNHGPSRRPLMLDPLRPASKVATNSCQKAPTP